MSRLIGYAGPWAVPLGILTVVIVASIVGAALETKHPPDAHAGAARPGAILFWGFTAAVLGFLGQCAALYRILTTVVAAEALSPRVVAEGFAGSFVPTLWGGALLLVSGVAWLVFRDRRPSHPAVLAVVLSLGAASLLGGCGPESSPAPADITQGVWVAQAGADQFLFDLEGTPPDSLRGVVHVMSGGKMTSEVTITRASWHAPALEMYMGPTRTTYRGELDARRGVVQGGLRYGDESGPAMELRWADPAGIPGFAARADAGPYVYELPARTDDGWALATPEEAGLDRAALEALVNAVGAGEAGLIHALVVVRGGKLVLDEYFHGYGPDDLHRLASSTKSVSSLLVGAALDRGLIEGLDAPLLGFFPDVPGPPSPGWRAMTLQHLLSMSMGLDWSAAEAENVHGTGEAFFRRVLSREVVDPPGTRWRYVNADVNLLAGVISRATGRHAEDFAREVLFTPLEIRAWDWSYGKEGGYNLMDGSLRLRARDLAKIGALVADSGRWSGREVVSAKLVAELTRTRFQTGTTLSGYGDLWWTGELPTGRGTEPVVVANGWGSQFAIVFPRLDLVVATTGGNEDNGRHMDIGLVLMRTLLPTL